MSNSMEGVPFIEAGKAREAAECRRTAEAFADVGCFVYEGTTADEITPPLTDMMVRYFRQPDEVKDRDVRKEVFHQVGRTPPFEETARPRPDRTDHFQPGHEITPFRGKDPKERFMAQVGPRPTTKKYAQFKAQNVVPEGFPEWSRLVNPWGEQAIEVTMAVLRMAAIGFGLPEDAFVKYLFGGQHLYAPTGSDLSKYGRVGTALAGAHGDLNFVSVHGQANMPGLYVWTRDGRRIKVVVPKGCMLVQAGMQFQHVTGGAVLEGLHEVIVTEDTLQSAAYREAIASGLVPWRVSTTLFAHAHSDLVLEPIGHFATDEALAAYPPTVAGEQVQRELDLIGLATTNVAIA